MAEGSGHEAMLQAKVQPEVISYNATMRACGKGGEWQRGLGMMHLADRGALGLDHRAVGTIWGNALSLQMPSACAPIRILDSRKFS